MRAAAPAQEEGNPYPSTAEKSTETGLRARSTAVRADGKMRTRPINVRKGPSERELNGGRVVS
jgi:hypothetical protein